MRKCIGISYDYVYFFTKKYPAASTAGYFIKNEFILKCLRIFF
jgi:hypothetical protein